MDNMKTGIVMGIFLFSSLIIDLDLHFKHSAQISKDHNAIKDDKKSN